MASGRFAVASDPAQESAFPIPHVVTPEAAKEMEEELRIELTEVGFTPRQTAEVVHAYRGYAALTQAWSRGHQRALEAEKEGDGFRAKAYELLIEARRTGAKIPDPKVLDRRSVEQMRAKAAGKHEKVTKKITGNWFVMACAVLLKAFLLLPLANRYLLAILPDADAVRGLVSLLLASVLAYTLTFVARYLVQVGVGMFGPEDGPKRRSVADILRPKANRTMFWFILAMFALVLGSFLSFDFMNAGADGVGVIGLTFLFVAILLVFEMFLAYRLAVLQDDQPESLESVDAVYLQALNCADNETDLAKMRTYAINAEENWRRFMRILDKGIRTRSVRQRLKAMTIVRETMGTVQEALERPHLNGKAVVRLDDATPVAAGETVG